MAERIEVATERMCDAMGWTVYQHDRALVREVLDAADAVMFAPENLARVSASTGLSLQTVAEVARELRKP